MFVQTLAARIVVIMHAYIVADLRKFRIVTIYKRVLCALIAMELILELVGIYTINDQLLYESGLFVMALTMSMYFFCCVGFTRSNVL